MHFALAAGRMTTQCVAFMDLSQWKSRFSTPRILLLGLSFLSLVICAGGATAHYSKWAWGNRAQPIGWLLSMLFLLLAFSPLPPRQIAARLKSLIKPKAAFFVFWSLVYVFSHLWNFRTAPWNGNGLYDESGWDLWFLKQFVIGHPYQAAWLDPVLTRETLFHYYVWGFFRLFGYNILSFEAAVSIIWFTTFIFTLLLVHLFFRSYIVTSITALIFTFLPFAFIYSFLGYRYPMATALGVASLYFLHLGFRTASSFFLSLGGILAGLCLASSTTGKQYLYGIFLFALLYAGLHWKTLKRSVKWSSLLKGSGKHFKNMIYRTLQRKPGSVFLASRVLASLFPMRCPFRWHTTFFWCPDLFLRCARGGMRLHCWRQFQLSELLSHICLSTACFWQFPSGSSSWHSPLRPCWN